MTRLSSLLLALALGLGGCAALPPGDADVDALLRASGIDAQLAWLEQPLPAGKLDGPLSLLPDDWISVINSTVADQVQPADIRHELRDRLRRDLSPRELAEVRRFFDSPTGRTVVAVESGSPPPPVGRSAGVDDAMLDALANASGLGQAVSRLAEAGLGDAVDIVMRSNCLGQGKVPFAGFVGGVLKKAQLKALRLRVNDEVRGRYAALPSGDRERYLAFTQSGAGRKFLHARAEVVGNAATRAGNALGKALTPRVNELCRPNE